MAFSRQVTGKLPTTHSKRMSQNNSNPGYPYSLATNPRPQTHSSASVGLRVGRRRDCLVSDSRGWSSVSRSLDCVVAGCRDCGFVSGRGAFAGSISGHGETDQGSGYADNPSYGRLVPSRGVRSCSRRSLAAVDKPVPLLAS